jgi:hypothetical protein
MKIGCNLSIRPVGTNSSREAHPEITGYSPFLNYRTVEPEVYGERGVLGAKTQES